MCLKMELLPYLANDNTGGGDIGVYFPIAWTIGVLCNNYFFLIERWLGRELSGLVLVSKYKALG